MVGCGCMSIARMVHTRAFRRPPAGLGTRTGRRSNQQKSFAWHSATRAALSIAATTCSCRSGRAVTELDPPFARVILEDFEFVSVPGERPDVVCMVFLDLNTGQTTRLWRDRLTDRLPYDGGNDTLVVSFVFNAEGSCHLALGQQLPKNVLDLSAEFKRHVNGKGIPRKNQGLIGALQYFGLSSIAPKRKDA